MPDQYERDAHPGYRRGQQGQEEQHQQPPAQPPKPPLFSPGQCNTLGSFVKSGIDFGGAGLAYKLINSFNTRSGAVNVVKYISSLAAAGYLGLMSLPVSTGPVGSFLSGGVTGSIGRVVLGCWKSRNTMDCLVNMTASGFSSIMNSASSSINGEGADEMPKATKRTPEQIQQRREERAARAREYRERYAVPPAPRAP